MSGQRPVTGDEVTVVLDWHAQCREHIAANMVRYALTPREQEVAWLMLSEWPLELIAEELSISYSTAKNHVSNLMDCMDLAVPHRSRPQVILRLLDLEGIQDA